MTTVIREMIKSDEAQITQMMRVFYASPYVHTNGSDEIFKNDIEACISDNPYLDGYVFEKDGNIIGYGMTAKSFSTEFGKQCIWIEDIYLKPEARNEGLGSRFLEFISKKYPDAALRLEVEEENERAVHVYKKNGYSVLPYTEMIKQADK